MLKIAYGICSEGMGHTTRSIAVIDYLLSKGHEVHIFTSDKAYNLLSRKYSNVYQIKGFHLVYEGDRLKNTRSVINIVKNLPKEFFPSLKKVENTFGEIKPNIVISDFEFFTALMGKRLGIPVISANNISIIARTKIDNQGMKSVYQKFVAESTEKLSTVSANLYIIPTFFQAPVKKKNVYLVDPPVRKTIINTKPKTGNHILVYQTSPTCLGLLKTLKGMDEKFIVYGFGKKPRSHNLVFYEFNEDKFINHLASSKAVIIGGGFSLLSEALYLKKPIMSVPLKGHFEQTTNAFYVKKNKFGEYCQNPTATDIRDFLLKLPFYRHYLNKLHFDPTMFARKIEQIARKEAKKN